MGGERTGDAFVIIIIVQVNKPVNGRLEFPFSFSFCAVLFSLWEFLSGPLLFSCWMFRVHHFTPCFWPFQPFFVSMSLTFAPSDSHCLSLFFSVSHSVSLSLPLPLSLSVCLTSCLSLPFSLSVCVSSSQCEALMESLLASLC